MWIWSSQEFPRSFTFERAQPTNLARVSAIFGSKVAALLLCTALCVANCQEPAQFARDSAIFFLAGSYFWISSAHSSFLSSHCTRTLFQVRLAHDGRVQPENSSVIEEGCVAFWISMKHSNGFVAFKRFSLGNLHQKRIHVAEAPPTLCKTSRHPSISVCARVLYFCNRVLVQKQNYANLALLKPRPLS